MLVLLAGGTCLAYGLLLAALWLQQERLVFPGAGRPERPVDALGVEVLQFEGQGGAPFRAAVAAPPSPRGVLAFFVGNGEDLTSAARRAVELSGYGVVVVTAEYPGYGGSSGRPSVPSILRAAEVTAAHAEALAAARGLPFLVGGSSMGSFCALHVAAAGRAVKCLLRAPPTSLIEAAADRFWWVPVRLLLRHRFDNNAVAPRVHCPVLIVHGDADRIVPLAHGRRLCERLAGSVELAVVAGAGHNDLPLAPDGPVGERVRRFLEAP